LKTQTALAPAVLWRGAGWMEKLKQAVPPEQLEEMVTALFETDGAD
jgi:hypothetical protein